MRLHRKQLRRRGFTFVELMIGIVVSSIVLSALVVFTFGVSENWVQSDSTQSTYLRETMAVGQLANIVRQAQSLEPNPTNGSLDLSTPAAACVIWNDTNGDGAIQYSELSMLQYLPASQSVVQWKLPANMNVYSPTTTYPLMPEDAFMQLNPASTTLAENVVGCQFFSVAGVNSPPQLQRPSLEVVLKISNSNAGLEPQVVYSTIALRAPLVTAQ